MDEMGHGYCFVCGQKSDVGLKLEFKLDRESRSASCETVLSEKYRGWSGYAHGGILASILDGAMVYACKSADLDCMTAELNIKYKMPVPLNKPIKIIAQVTDQKKWLSYVVVYTEALMEVDGKIATSAEAKMFVDKNIASMEHFKSTLQTAGPGG